MKRACLGSSSFPKRVARYKDAEAAALEHAEKEHKKREASIFTPYKSAEDWVKRAVHPLADPHGIESRPENRNMPMFFMPRLDALRSFPMHLIQQNGFAFINLREDLRAKDYEEAKEKLKSIIDDARVRGPAASGFDGIHAGRYLKETRFDPEADEAVRKCEFGMKLLSRISTESTLVNVPVAEDLQLPSLVYNDPHVPIQNMHMDLGGEGALDFNFENGQRHSMAAICNISSTSTYLRAVPRSHHFQEGDFNNISDLILLELHELDAVVFFGTFIHSGYTNVVPNMRLHFYLGMTQEEKDKYFAPVEDEKGKKGTSNTYWLPEEMYGIFNGENARKRLSLNQKSMMKTNVTKAQQRQKMKEKMADLRRLKRK